MLTLNVSSTTREEREKEVDRAIEEFDEYFSRLQGAGGRLTQYERAAIKTFCAFKLGLGPDNPTTEGQEDGKTSSS